jgi:phosphatidylethanolamine-binding protein (PEBP) family uncharacterized protein
MAQRTGSERLIELLRKTTSVGAILALVVVLALAGSGCGGGSDAQTASAPRPVADSDRTEDPAQPSTKGAASSEPAPSRQNGAQGASAISGSKASSGAKRGTRIKLPKGAPEPEPTQAQKVEATVADIVLQSPAITTVEGGSATLPIPYTCDGEDSWPALRWQGVPTDSKELVLFAMNVQPVGERLFFDWAVAGLNPVLEGVEAGRLPPGAVVGVNGFGKSDYSICPTSAGETYVFALYALPQALSPHKGFEPHALRDEVLRISGNVGLLAASYVH